MKKILKLSIIILAIFCSISNTLALFSTTTDLKSIFNTKKYNFNLNATGGIFENSDININDKIIVLPIPVKNGYNFLGYSDSLNGNVIYSNNINDINLINNTSVYAKWNTKTYTITYDLNGGMLNNPIYNYNVEDNFTLPIPVKNGYDFVGWTGTGVSTPTYNFTISNSTGNKTFTANWKAKKYSVDINSIIQNIAYSAGLSGFTFSVWINDKQVADHVIDYYNDSVDYGSNVRVYIYDRDGYSVTSFRDQTWTVTNNITINPTWYDNIAPTITSFTVENLGYYDPNKGAAAGWNIRVTINAYDNGTGIQKYQMWIKPYLNGSGSTVHETSSRVFTNVLYLQSGGRTFCATAIDNAGNKSEKCDTIRV